MYINKDTTILIQGITGKEGQRATQRMINYGSNVVAGVRPGKAGETVLDVPVYNTVKDAIAAEGTIDATAIYVPPFAAKAAIIEAIEAGVKLITCVVERVPIKDTAECLELAKLHGVTIIGPTSFGVMKPGVGRLGVIGGPVELVDEIYTPGNIGIISRSGGMTNELSWQVKKHGLGQSTVIHVGGDLLMGTTYADILKKFQKDDQTKGVILFGEHGGSYEFEIVDIIKSGKFSKPLVVYVGGKFANTLPEGMHIGHAGAIVEKGKGAKEKKEALESVGVTVVDRYEELVPQIKKLINHND